MHFQRRKGLGSERAALRYVLRSQAESVERLRDRNSLTVPPFQRGGDDLPCHRHRAEEGKPESNTLLFAERDDLKRKRKLFVGEQRERLKCKHYTQRPVERSSIWDCVDVREQHDARCGAIRRRPHSTHVSGV